MLIAGGPDQDSTAGPCCPITRVRIPPETFTFTLIARVQIVQALDAPFHSPPFKTTPSAQIQTLSARYLPPALSRE